MTAEEKAALAAFLDIAEDCLRDGRRLARPAAVFTGDPPPETPGAAEETPADFARPDTARPDTARTDTARTDTARTDTARMLEAVAEEVRACAACGLSRTRNRAAPGEGVTRPLVLVIGEGPGRDEDAGGRPFVGRAGQLLDRMLAAIGLSRQKNCFIANIVKCRPPDAEGRDRPPSPEEIACCRHFLERQIELLAPKLILCAGRISAQTMLGTAEGIGKLRGRFHVWRGAAEFPDLSPENPGIPLLATYHPSALLREEAKKRPAWEDLKLLRARLAELDADYAASAEVQSPA